MNRTLKRPMFRIGGSAGTGITSGLTMPRASYSEGTRKDKIKKIVTEDQAIMDELAPSRQSPLAPGTLSSFLIGTGLNLASATPRGKGLSGIVSTAAESAKGPFAQFQKGVFARDASDDQLKKSLVSRAITKVDEADKPEKLGTTKKVLDVDTGNEVFATELQIQSTMSTKDGTQMKYVPIPSAEKKEKPMAVYDTVTKSEVFALPSELLSKTDDGNLRFLPIGKADQLVRAYPIVDGKTVPKPIFVTKAEVIANPKLYEPVEGNIEMMLKVDDFKQEKQIKQDATKQMLAARDVSSIIRRLEKDIMDGGAFTGNAGDTVGFLTGVSGFVDQFVNKQRDVDKTLYNQQYRDAAEAIEILQNDDTINAKLTRFLNAPETQAAKTSVVNLAYALAKAREPGGRFSVADIELALRSIGESSNKMSFLAGLKRTGLEATERAIKDYETVFNLTREDLPIKFKEVIDNYNYFGGFQVEGDGDLKPSKLEF